MKMLEWRRTGRKRNLILSDDDFITYHRERGLRDLYFFTKYVCAMGAGPDGSWLEAPLHVNLAWAWQRPNGDEENGILYGQERMALMPRASLKSTLLTQGMALWVLTKNPEERILIYSSNFTMAVLLLTPIRQLLQGQGQHAELFQACYGSRLTPSDRVKKKWSEDMITVKRSGVYTDPSIRASGVGSNLVGGHFTWEFVDDVVGEELSRSQMEKTCSSVDNLTTMYSSLAEGQRRTCGTRWAFFDPYAKAEDSDPHCLVALRTWCEKGGRPSKEYVKENLIFSHFEVKKALKLKRDNPFFFSCQMENNPRDEEKLGFKRSWFRYARRHGDYLVDLDAEGKEERKVKLNECNIFVLVDPNTGRQPGTRTADGNIRKKVDYVGIIVLAVSQDNTWYVLRVYRKRWSVDRFVDESFALMDIWPAKWMAIETRAAQIVFFNVFRERFKAGKKPFVLVEWPGGLDKKEELIKALQSRYSNGMIRHLQGSTEVNEGVALLEEELEDFPNAEFDDASNALGAATYPHVVFAPGSVPKLHDTLSDFERMMLPLDPGSQRTWRNYEQQKEDIALGISGNFFANDMVGEEEIQYV